MPTLIYQGGGSGINDKNLLSIGEVIVQGCAVATAPVVDAVNPQGVYVGLAYSLQIIANDINNEDTLTYSATGLPAGISIDALTGLISGSTSVTGNFSIVVDVTDGVFTDSVSFDLTVADASTQCATPTNIASEGTASQSSDYNTTAGGKQGD